MIKISVVVITLNEERNIGRCLQSVSGLADEIIVVDSFSTDRTAEICQAAGARFILRTWEGYSNTKNYAASQASHDWILSLDADEAVSDTLRASLQKIKSGQAMPSGEFNRLTRYENHWVRHCGWYPDKKLRLYDRRKASWQGDLHEKLVPVSPEPVIFLEGDLLHFSYYTREEHLAQIRRFSEIGARQLYDQGQEAGWAKIFVKTVSKFLKVFIVKLGFLDGTTGWVISVNSARESWMRYTGLRNLQRNKKTA